jgi:phosphoribosylanthranilate isomerase
MIAEICELLNAEAPHVWSFLLTPEQDVAAIVRQQKRLKANTLQLVDALTAGTHADLRRALPSVRIVQVRGSLVSWGLLHGTLMT